MNDQSARHPELDALERLLGEWGIEATHPAFEGIVVKGRATFEWLEGERFLVYRSVTDHPDFPDSISVIGATDVGMSMNYFDSRGVHRIYAVSAGEDALRIWRDDPAMAQRFTGTYGDDVIDGLWEMSRDGSAWSDDLRITYRRLG